MRRGEIIDVDQMAEALAATEEGRRAYGRALGSRRVDGWKKLTPEVTAAIRADRAAGVTQEECAEKYKVSVRSVARATSDGTKTRKANSLRSPLKPFRKTLRLGKGKT